MTVETKLQKVMRIRQELADAVNDYSMSLDWSPLLESRRKAYGDDYPYLDETSMPWLPRGVGFVRIDCRTGEILSEYGGGDSALYARVLCGVAPVNYLDVEAALRTREKWHSELAAAEEFGRQLEKLPPTVREKFQELLGRVERIEERFPEMED